MSSTDASSRSAARWRAEASNRPDASCTDEPTIWADREPPVLCPVGISSVSPWWISTLSRGTPRRLLTIIAQVVSWPWP